MPRSKREYSEYLHVVARGINRQELFIDDDDREFMLQMIKKFKIEENISIIVFCLMSNHIHILINDPNKKVSVFMKKLCTTYSVYFNKKYERCGYLFQNRFSSQVITDEKYMLTVYRYILLNPEKAGICKYYSYRWSTMVEVGKNKTVTDFDVSRKILGDIPLEEIKSENEDYSTCIDVSKPKHDDDWALNVIRTSLGLQNAEAISEFPKSKQKQAIILLLDSGLTERQIERLTGIGRTIIHGIHQEGRTPVA